MSSPCVARLTLFIGVLAAIISGLSCPAPAAAQNLAVGETFRDCPQCPKMVVVPAGDVLLGSQDDEPGRTAEEGPQRSIAIRAPFAIGQFEVTFEEWDACVTIGGCSHKPDDKGWGRGRRPVINVSWNQVTSQYLPWLSRKAGQTYRLPSEAEWEYAARGGTTSRYWWGQDAGRGMANCKGCAGNYSGKTATVGSFAANPFGLYDITGNVFEHTADCWNPTHHGVPEDGRVRTKGNCGRRVIRGGSWYTGPDWIRPSARSSDPVKYSNANVGFRVARSLPVSPNADVAKSPPGPAAPNVKHGTIETPGALCHLNEAAGRITPADVTLTAAKNTAPIPAGTPTTLRWALRRALDQRCRTPLYLVVSTSVPTRFEGSGFLAIPKGQPGPFDIQYAIDKTRLFFALHLLDTREGTFQIKAYATGALDLEWALVEVPRTAGSPLSRADFALGREVVAVGAQLHTVAQYTAGSPRIVVRDKFTLDLPKKVVRSISGAFELQIFDGFYRVLDTQTEELLLERAGHDPNFSPGSRFVAAFVEGGKDRHVFAPDMPAPNLEVVDLFSQTVVAQVERPLFLAWSHGDTFFAPGGIPCFRNSCSAHLVAYSSLIDGAPFVLSPLTNTYKSFPLGFQISINLETALAAVRGLEGRARSSDSGWLSLVTPSLRSDKFQERDQPRALRRALSMALMSGQPLFDPLIQGGQETLDWFLQGKRFSVSHHCIPDQHGQCAGGTDEKYGLASLRVEHGRVASSVIRAPTSSSPAGAVLRAQSIWRGATVTADTSEEKLPTLLESLVPGLSSKASETQIKPELIKFEAWTGDWHQAAAHFKSIKDHVRKWSARAADFLLDEDTAQALDAPTSGGCIDEVTPGGAHKSIDVVLTHQILEMHAWNIKGAAGWLFGTSCTNGASGRYWLWLLLGSDSRPPALINLTHELRQKINASVPIKVRGAQMEEDHWDWAQTVDSIHIAFDRYALISGTWPWGRWAVVFDLERRAVKSFIPKIDNAESFDVLALTKDAQTLVQVNGNGQLVFYDLATGAAVLRGVETDDEWVVYDAHGYYMSSPEGGQFVHLKFPGVAGYHTFQQFASTLKRPDLIKERLGGDAKVPPPDLTPPPALDMDATISRDSGRRTASVKFKATSTVGLRSLVIFVDGHPVRQEPLSGNTTSATILVPLPPQARWLAAIIVDMRGYESVEREKEFTDPAPPRGSTLYGIAFGTNEYTDQNLINLYGAEKDAAEIAKLLKESSAKLYAKVEVGDPIDPAQLRKALPERLRKVVQEAGPNDTILLFAAGHGIVGADKKLYLATQDTITDDLAGTALAWEDIAREFDGARARVVVLLDVCRAGTAGLATNDDAVFSLTSRAHSIAVLAASKGRQKSKEERDGGYFTKAIVAAVRSRSIETDTNKNGVIELTELYGAIKGVVVRQTDGKQTPWIARNRMIGRAPLF